MKKIILLLTVLFFGTSSSVAQVSEAWVSDQGDGTYINPVINADYSDPDVVGVDGDYYMTASSFCQAPGLPILHSKDLVNWTIVNNALDHLVPEDFYSIPRHGKGVWAPSIRFHNGEYYIFWGDPDFGVFMIKTKDPKSAWSEPLLIWPGKGIIDTTPLWDEDGKAYLVNAWAASRSGMNSVITLTEMKPDGTGLIGKPAIVYDGNVEGNHTVEGPKIYKRDGWYYILAPAGGVATGWQIALRSRNPFGPYECKTVMSQGKTDINGPHQGALVDMPDGKSYFLHFQDKGFMGRVIHLNPVNWIDGWPTMGNNGEPVPADRKPLSISEPMTPHDSDDFNSHVLGSQWTWVANYQPLFGFPSSDGYIRIYGHTVSEGFVNFWEVPNVLTQRFPSDRFTATAKMKITARNAGQQSGLIVFGWDYARLSAEFDGKNFELKLITCTDAENGSTEVSHTITDITPKEYPAGLYPNYECNVWMRVNVEPSGNCRFYYSLDGKKYKDINIPFKARQGKWVGARIGFFSIQPSGTPDRGWIDVDSFDITK